MGVVGSHNVLQRGMVNSYLLRHKAHAARQAQRFPHMAAHLHKSLKPRIKYYHA